MHANILAEPSHSAGPRASPSVSGDGSGYAHPLYAQSLSEVGTPVRLERCGGWVLRRRIRNTEYFDATGCYPLFCCRDWSSLELDLQELSRQHVSLAMVADPFANLDLEQMTRCFDRVAPFKEHVIVDLREDCTAAMTKHHRYDARRALREVVVDRCENPSELLEQWISLYSNLIRRHELTGIKAFSRHAFDLQLRVPGLVMLRASYRGELVGAHLWYVQGNVAQSHLMSMNETGYKANASYALYWEAIMRAREFFPPNVQWLNLGAGAGINASSTDGLARFKRGWSPHSRPVHFLGRIFDPKKYEQLTAEAGKSGSNYFPAYREGEFG